MIPDPVLIIDAYEIKGNQIHCGLLALHAGLLPDIYEMIEGGEAIKVKLTISNENGDRPALYKNVAMEVVA